MHSMTRYISLALLLFLACTQVHGYVKFAISARLLGSFPETSKTLMACLTADGANCTGRQWIWTERVLNTTEARTGMGVVRYDQLLEPWEAEKGQKRYLIAQLLPALDNWGAWDTANLSILHPDGLNVMHVQPMLNATFDFYVKIECAHGFYGHECADGCLHVEGHHSCSPNGTWVCVEGRWGEFCDFPKAYQKDGAAQADKLHASAPGNADSDRMTLIAVGSILIVAAALTAYTLRRRRARSTAQLAEEAPMVLVE